jgi:arylsulfatase A-like enzyme
LDVASLSSTTKEKRPNVILITTDQQRKDSLGCYGSDFVHTPNLDRLAREGVQFERSYCTSPVCTPSRASIYSGKYVSKHGAWNVGTTLSEEEACLPHLLKESGYQTYHIGKLHFQPFLAPAEQSKETVPEWAKLYPEFTGPYYGFDQIEMCMGHTTNGVAGHYGDWVRKKTGTAQFPHESLASSSFGGEAIKWDIPSGCTNTDWVRERTLAFLDEQVNVDQPFFLSVGFQDPHHPHALPDEYAQDLHPELMPLPQFTKGELDDKPPYFNEVHNGRWSKDHPLHGRYAMAGQGFDSYNYHEVTEEDARLGRAYYYRMVELIDQAIGDIMRSLDERGLTNDTIIVFTSDHGELLGDHGIWMKGPFLYEQLISVPLIFSWKGSLKVNKLNSDMISLVDLTPTLLSLCNLPIPEDMDGLDMSTVLQQGESSPRQAALIEHIDDPSKIRLKTVVTDRYKMTVYIGQSYGELYDFVEDSGEIINLWNNPEYMEIRQDLYGKLLLELENIEKRADRISYA